MSIEGINLEKLGAYLFNEYRIITTSIDNAGDVRGLRITPNIYTTLQKIDIFAEVMERILMRTIFFSFSV